MNRRQTEIFNNYNNSQSGDVPTGHAQYLGNGVFKQPLNTVNWDDSDQSDPEDYTDCEIRGPVELENGALYTG